MLTQSNIDRFFILVFQLRFALKIKPINLDLHESQLPALNCPSKTCPCQLQNRAAPHMKMDPRQELKALGCLGLAGAGQIHVCQDWLWSHWLSLLEAQGYLDTICHLKTSKERSVTSKIFSGHDLGRHWRIASLLDAQCVFMDFCRIGCTEMDFPCMWFVPTLTALLLPIPHTRSLFSSGSLSHFYTENMRIHEGDISGK